MPGQGPFDGPQSDPELAALLQRNPSGGAVAVPEGMNAQEMQIRRMAESMGIPGAMQLPIAELQKLVFQANSIKMKGGAAPVEDGGMGQGIPPHQPPTFMPEDPNAPLKQAMGQGG